MWAFFTHFLAMWRFNTWTYHNCPHYYWNNNESDCLSGKV